MEKRDLNKILLKKLVIFIKIFCNKTLIKYSDTFIYILKTNRCKTKF